MKTAPARRKLDAISVRDFSISATDKARLRLHRYDLEARIEVLSRNVYVHEYDPDFARSVLGWRRELLGAKLERDALLSAQL
jgi:hypothetical protein